MLNNNVRLIPYKLGSTSAKAIAQSLEVLRVAPDSATFKNKRRRTFINWGCSTPPIWWDESIHHTLLNQFNSVKKACNKLTTMVELTNQNVSCPSWTEDIEEAKCWILGGSRVYCRTILNGFGGVGIVVANIEEELVEAPLYTVGVKAGKEFRVHVFNNEVIDYAKKARRYNTTEDRASHIIRNYKSGWIFIREGVELPQILAETAIKAIQVLGLNFGAVDIALSRDETRCWVYEVNTSPGMTKDATTCRRYCKAIKEVLCQ